MTPAAAAQPRSNLYLYITVFISGMTTLAVEMVASRLLGSVFGTSNLVWANVIGLMLLYLTAGYFIGGRWADRSPRRTTFYTLLIWGAFLCAAVPLAARPVLQAAAFAVAGADAGVALGSAVAVLVLFAVPVTALGTASPFAIRLAVTDIASAGKTSGRIYAISTLGSLVGTFLPVLLIIPEVGTFGTFILFSGILYAVALFGLFREIGPRALIYLWMPALIALLSALVLNGALRAPAGDAVLLYEDESAYNYIQVQQLPDGTRYLLLNEGQGVHSQWTPEIRATGRTWDFFLTGPYFNADFSPDDMQGLVVVGLAGGTIARQYGAIYPDIRMDGIEIDPAIVEAGARWFDMNAASMPNLNVIVEDGRYGLRDLPAGSYSVAALDAYRPPYIPWHLTTVEFFEEVRALLTDDGTVVINVGRTPSDRRLVDALTATLLEVFPSVHAMDVPYSFNTILVATVQPSSQDNLAANIARLPSDAPEMLRQVLELGARSLVPARASDLVFRDDRAPVETLVDSLVLNFLLSGGAEQLQGG
jgi:predicted membrane-bound spermidine synthase